MNAYSPTSACGAGCLPRPATVPTVTAPVRLLRHLAIVAWLLSAVGLAFVLPVLSKAMRRAAVRIWFRALLRACGVTVVLHGGSLPTRPGDRTGTLIVANHVSWLDIPAVLAMDPVRVIGKSDVRSWPLLGGLAARTGAIFIDRRRLRRLPATVAEVADALRNGQDVLAFPEGSTWCGRTTGRFYPALFQSAVDAGAQVLPVALRYRLASGEPTTVAAFVGDDTLLASLRRVIATRGLIVDVDLRRRIPATRNGIGNRTARRALAGHTLAEIHGRAPVSELASATSSRG